MITRLAEAGDFSALKQLWINAFGDSSQYCEEFFKKRTNPDGIPVAEEKGEIVSALHLQPREFSFGGAIVNGSNLVGAATDDKLRKMGFMDYLLRASLKIMKDRGETLCALKPFLHRFYNKYGWETCCNEHKYIIKPESSGNELESHIISEISSEHIIQLNEIYEKNNSFFHMKRSPEDWAFRLWDFKYSGGFVIINQLGYALCTFDGQCAKIEESFYRNEKSLNSLINEIEKSIHPGNIYLKTLNKINYDFVCDEKISDYTMIRIIDLKRLSGVINVNETLITEDVFNITDEAAPWNRGIYSFARRQEKLIIEPADGVKTYKTKDIREITGEIFHKNNTIIYEEY